MDERSEAADGPRMNDVARVAPKSQTSAGWGSDAIATRVGLTHMPGTRIRYPAAAAGAIEAPSIR